MEIEAGKSWDNEAVECSKSIAQIYLSDQGSEEKESNAMSLTIDRWTLTMTKLNKDIDVDKFSKLSIEEKLQLTFPSPHPSLGKWAQKVRTLVAVVQKLQ